MNSAGQSGDRKSYRVILLLAVGLTAFSSAMKELNLLREFSRDTSNMVASWSNALTPQVPQAPKLVVPVEVPVPVEKAEVCESSHTVNEVEPVDQGDLGGGVARAEVKIKDVGKTFVAERSRPRYTKGDTRAMATLRANRSADIELLKLPQIPREANLKVTIMADSDREGDFAFPSSFEFKLPKVKTLNRHIIIKPEEREVLKSLNRSLNSRSAG